MSKESAQRLVEWEGWDLDPVRCPCDSHFLDWLRTQEPGKRILHMGTGLHHIVGLSRWGNVLGVTATKAEHATYLDLVAVEPSLASCYQVWLGDIYDMDTTELPVFDAISLFHLGEEHLTEYPGRKAELELLTRLTPHLRIGGHILLYAGSLAYNWAWLQAQVAEWLSCNCFEQVEDYKSLKLFRRI